MILRGLGGDDDVAALHALAGRGSLAELGGQLRDGGHRGGACVVIAEDGGAVVGGAGWVEAPPWCYGAPVIARERAVAAALVDHVLERARACAAEQVRISCFPDEPGKRAALLAAGFAPQLDFITLARRGAAAGARWAGTWPRLPWDALDAARFADVLNDTFVDVPNAPPLAADEMRALLDRPLTCRDATAAYGDNSNYQAFVHVEHDVDDDGPYAIIATIGVRTGHRGRGLAGAVLDDALARIAEPECRALIASTNTASLALHASRGFVERSRRTVYQRAVPPMGFSGEPSGLP